MNVTFHALGSFATAAVLSSFLKEKSWNILKLLIGFIAGILIHGVLDILPHEYPLTAKFDIFTALFLLALVVFLAKRQYWLLILVCFSGAIFPDVVDLGGEIANKHLGLSLPYLPFDIFPWHWKRFSGSIYDSSRRMESNIYHAALVLICMILVYFYGKQFWAFKKP